MVDAGSELVAVMDVVGVMDSVVVDSADVCMDEVMMVVDGGTLKHFAGLFLSAFMDSKLVVVDAGCF